MPSRSAFAASEINIPNKRMIPQKHPFPLITGKANKAIKIAPGNPEQSLYDLIDQAITAFL